MIVNKNNNFWSLRLNFDLNFETIKQVLRWLDIKVEIVIESELRVSGQPTERLVKVCKKLGADTYISGIGGKRYLDEKLFEKNKIILKHQNYNPIRYLQHMSESFIPNLSIIDLLANVGSESGKLLKESNWFLILLINIMGFADFFFNKINI
mgnify:CR=1 FL=1